MKFLLPDGEELLTVKGVAHKLHVNPFSVRRWACKGQLKPDLRMGNNLLFKLSTINRWNMNRPKMGPKGPRRPHVKS